MTAHRREERGDRERTAEKPKGVKHANETTATRSDDGDREGRERIQEGRGERREGMKWGDSALAGTPARAPGLTYLASKRTKLLQVVAARWLSGGSLSAHPTVIGQAISVHQ